jgi:hypothetical protein
MNHSRRGRIWSDEPHQSAGVLDSYAIAKVSLKVSRGGSNGRWEAHEHSRGLLLRFDSIGKRKLDLVGMSIGGESLPNLMTVALSLYLRSANGLKYFRRIQPLGATRSVLCDLLSRIGIPTHNVLRPQSTDQVPAGLKDPAGIGADRRLSLSGVQRE